MQAREGQSERLVPAVHAIEHLHAIARRALHQVIQRRHHHHPLLPGVVFKADIAEIAAYQDLRLRIAIDAVALFDQAYKWLALIGFAVDGL